MFQLYVSEEERCSFSEYVLYLLYATIHTHCPLPGQSLDDDLYLLVELEKWGKIEGRDDMHQFLLAKLLKRTPKERILLPTRV